MKVKRLLLFECVTMMAFFAAAAPVRADNPKSQEAFDRLASLQGEWRGEQGGKKILRFGEVPTRRVDALQTAEARIV